MKPLPIGRRETPTVIVPFARGHGPRVKPGARGSLLPPGLDAELRALEHRARGERDIPAALGRAVETIWRIVEQAASEPILDSGRGVSALFARREFVERSTCLLSALVQRGVAAGVFQPHCSSWAIARLPYAIVAGGCAHWVLGISAKPSLRASTAVRAMLDVLGTAPGAHGLGRPPLAIQRVPAEPQTKSA
jgi:hypothetical protein